MPVYGRGLLARSSLTVAFTIKAGSAALKDAPKPNDLTYNGFKQEFDRGIGQFLLDFHNHRFRLCITGAVVALHFVPDLINTCIGLVQRHNGILHCKEQGGICRAAGGQDGPGLYRRAPGAY